MSTYLYICIYDATKIRHLTAPTNKPQANILTCEFPHRPGRHPRHIH